mgnify:CR=1 FL=1
MVSLILRFKKKGMLRFLSNLETIKAIERTLRRAKIPMEFSRGFHPMPKFTFLDALPTGVVNLSLYLKVSLVERVDNVKERINEVALDDLKVHEYWYIDVNMNELVRYYRFRIILPEDLDFENLLVEKRGKRIKVGDYIEDVKKVRLKDFHMLEYVQRRDKLLNPWLFLKDFEGSLTIPICVEALTEKKEDLSSFLDRRVKDAENDPTG